MTYEIKHEEKMDLEQTNKQTKKQRKANQVLLVTNQWTPGECEVLLK